MEWAYSQGASDLHCSTNQSVYIRVEGQLIPIDEQQIDPTAMDSFLHQLKKEEISQEEKDFPFDHPAGFRVRIHLYQQGGCLSLSCRFFPKRIPLPKELGLPTILCDWMQQKHGLILVTGPTGSGKSTTLASLIHWLIEQKALRVITLEDPVEYIHSSRLSMVEQREVGKDTASFVSGVRAALRQDPDILVIGELRDTETIHAAIRLSEAGKLVLGTLHTARAIGATGRVADFFKAEQRDQVLSQLAMTLIGVVSQRLILDDAGRRSAIFEVLVNTPAMSHLIRSNQVHQMESLMQVSRMHGMQTFENV